MCFEHSAEGIPKLQHFATKRHANRASTSSVQSTSTATFQLHFTLFFLLLQALFFTPTSASPFIDVSGSVGLQRWRGPSLKYGGATIADFDGDGWPDILIGHHDQFPAELYFNQKNGKFLRADWKFFHDTHAFAPFHATPTSRTLHFFASTGGNFGLEPTSPKLFGAETVRGKLREVKKLTQVFFAKGRGRAVVPISLTHSIKQQWWPDFMFLNAPPITTGAENKRRSSQQQQHYAGTLINGRFTKQRRLKGFTNVKNSYGVPIDVNNDGEMELITWNTLRVHRVTGYFTLTDISSHVLPREINFRAVVSVAEFDYDNDGHMDLYVARSVTNDISWMVEQVGREPSDILLRNVGGRFMDMTSLAGIPPGGESRGVTTGDFDNDGYADILVTQYKGRDWLLMNNGDGSFRREVSLGYKKSDVTRGDQPTAVDYDRDGWIDVVLSEGSFTDRKHGGYTRVMRNVLGNSVGSDRTWLLVSVGAAPDGKTSSMHAVVRVRTGSGLDMIRRVGAAGTVSGVSFIEEVHFGLGSFEGVATVAVRWRDGSRTTVFSKGNRMLKVGVFG